MNCDEPRLSILQMVEVGRRMIHNYLCCARACEITAEELIAVYTAFKGALDDVTGSHIDDFALGTIIEEQLEWARQHFQCEEPA